MESILSNIKSVLDVTNLNEGQLVALSQELRDVIKQTAYVRGGHLAPSLGAVESITALCNVFNFEKDKIVFDVGHQSYAYKILCRGAERFSTLRTEGGESGFPDGEKNDYFIGGHAGNSLSASIGLATARDIAGDDYTVVCYVGDASFFNGENLEAFFASEKKPSKIIIVFNDNGMSISENENGAYKFLSKLSRKVSYKKTKKFLRKLFGNNAIGGFLRKMRYIIKRTLSPVNAMEAIGFRYHGVFDGHDIKQLTTVFNDVKQNGRSAFIHIKTTKGKGYEPAETFSEKYHGIASGYETSENTFSNAVSSILEKIALKDDKVVAVTAGMKTGTGLESFSQKFPSKFFDVGICEEHAVTLSAGLALGGLKPVVCIYSTFLQRSFDQIISDVCMQNAPVVFLVDRAGYVGSDGKTHQGLFDISYLKMMPGLTLLAPKDCDELEVMLSYALTLNKPVAIRYPNGKSQPISTLTPFSEQNRWEILREGNSVALFAVGPRLNQLALNVASRFDGEVAVVNARSIKPMDIQVLEKYSNHKIITLEENIQSGGFGEGVLAYFNENAFSGKVTVLASGDNFVAHAEVCSQLSNNGFSEEKLEKLIKDLLL